MAVLQSRQNQSCDSFGRCYYYSNSKWSEWGRWILLGAAVIFFALVGLAFACFNNRRRRKQGRVPYRGTGWLGGRPAQATGTTNEPDYNNAGGAPNYNQGNQGYDGGGGGAGGANSDYYGQQNGVELQAPAPTYGGGNGYAPPPGPPPPGKDAVIR